MVGLILTWLVVAVAVAIGIAHLLRPTWRKAQLALLVGNAVSAIAMARCANHWQVGGVAIAVGFDAAVGCICLAVVVRFFCPDAALFRKPAPRVERGILRAWRRSSVQA